MKSRAIMRKLLLCAAIAGCFCAVHAKSSEQDDKLPIIVQGGAMNTESEDEEFKGEPKLSREVVLPTKGVWYVWLQVTHHGMSSEGLGRGGAIPVVVKYDLDGEKPLRGPRTPSRGWAR